VELFLYMFVGFLNIIPIVYGIPNFKYFGKSLRVFYIGYLASFLLWLLSNVLKYYSFNTHILYYIVPVIRCTFQCLFFRYALTNLKWANYITSLPVIVFIYIVSNLLIFGERKMAVDLFLIVDSLTVGLGLFFLWFQITYENKLTINPLFWINIELIESSFLNILSNFFLGQFYEYFNNVYFNMINYGFWAIVGIINLCIIVYAMVRARSKLPDLDEIPSF